MSATSTSGLSVRGWLLLVNNVKEGALLLPFETLSQIRYLYHWLVTLDRNSGIGSWLKDLSFLSPINYLFNSKGTCIRPTLLFTSHTMFSLSCVVWGMDCYGCKVTCPDGCSTGRCKYVKNKNKKWYYSLGWTAGLMLGQRLLCVILNLCLIFILIQECWQLTLEFTGELLFDKFFKKGWKLDITRGNLCIYIFKRHASTGNKDLFPFNMP